MDTAEFTICFILFCLQTFVCVNITKDTDEFTIGCIPNSNPDLTEANQQYGTFQNRKQNQFIIKRMDQLHCILIEFNHIGQKKGILFHVCVFLQLHLTVLTVFCTCFSSEPAVYSVATFSLLFSKFTYLRKSSPHFISNYDENC